MSIDAIADIVTDPEELKRTSARLLSRFPQFEKYFPDTVTIPWPGTLCIRITPHFISLLNYAEGFGHTTNFTLD